MSEEEKDCPLTVTEWLMFLSGERNAIEMRFDMIWNIDIVISIAFATFLLMCLAIYFGSDDRIMWVFFILVPACVLYVVHCHKKIERETEEKSKFLEEIIDGILNGSKNDPNEIRDSYFRWKRDTKPE